MGVVARLGLGSALLAVLLLPGCRLLPPAVRSPPARSGLSAAAVARVARSVSSLERMDQIEAISLPTADGQAAPLLSIATVQLRMTPARLDRLDRRRVLWVTVRGADVDALRGAIRSVAAEVGLPPGVAVTLVE